MGYWHTLLGGRVQPPWMRSAALRELQRNFPLRSSDIVIASYPRCGTTLMQMIVLLLLQGGDESKVLSPRLQVPWIELYANAFQNGVQELAAWRGKIDVPPSVLPRRPFKTHAPVDLLPWRGGLAGRGGAKVVVVTRNPKDACVSMFHHSKDIPDFEYTGDFAHFVKARFLTGEVESGCFWEWHAGWERAAEEHPRTVTWVSYEELARDFSRTVRRLGQFLDIPLSEELLARTRNASSFRSMKAQDVKTNAWLEAKGRPVAKKHIRKGEMGSWRGQIHGALLAEFDAVRSAKTALSGLKYLFDYGDP